uniref:Uncharacterized protein n=1 Tax=Anguilla anguilla TaxID=7936 RepID=A0A0E9XP82_ANGAN
MNWIVSIQHLIHRANAQKQRSAYVS